MHVLDLPDDGVTAHRVLTAHLARIRWQQRVDTLPPGPERDEALELLGLVSRVGAFLVALEKT